MIVVGDLVGEIGDLRLEPRLSAPDEALAQLAELAGVAQRAVLEDAFAAFEGEVEPGKLRVALLELIHHAQRLQVVLEAAVVAHAVVERVLAGVTERRVAEVVRQADRLRQRLVQR